MIWPLLTLSHLLAFSSLMMSRSMTSLHWRQTHLRGGKRSIRAFKEVLYLQAKISLGSNGEKMASVTCGKRLDKTKSTAGDIPPSPDGRELAAEKRKSPFLRSIHVFTSMAKGAFSKARVFPKHTNPSFQNLPSNRSRTFPGEAAAMVTGCYT